MLALLLDVGAITRRRAHREPPASPRSTGFIPTSSSRTSRFPTRTASRSCASCAALGPDEGGWIPAIAISGHGDAEHVREAILAGFQLHMPKPIDPPI